MGEGDLASNKGGLSSITLWDGRALGQSLVGRPSYGGRFLPAPLTNRDHARKRRYRRRGPIRILRGDLTPTHLNPESMARSGVLGGIIASVIGALVSLLIERTWKRRRERKLLLEQQDSRTKEQQQ